MSEPQYLLPRQPVSKSSRLNHSLRPTHQPLPSPRLLHLIRAVHNCRTHQRWRYLAYVAIVKICLSPKDLLQLTRIVSPMHVSHAGKGRPSAAENVRFASTAKTSSSCAGMRTENAIEPKSECLSKSFHCLTDLFDHRQLGNLATRVEEYEQLLEDLSLRAGVQDQTLIRRTLDRVKCLDCMIRHSG